MDFFKFFDKSGTLMDKSAIWTIIRYKLTRTLVFTNVHLFKDVLTTWRRNTGHPPWFAVFPH